MLYSLEICLKIAFHDIILLIVHLYSEIIVKCLLGMEGLVVGRYQV